MSAESSLIIKKYEGFGGNFLDSQYLGAAYETEKPHIFQNTLAKIYSSKSRHFDLKPLTSLIGQKNVIEIDHEIYRWSLQGAEERTAISQEVLADANTTPGLNNTTFNIKLDIDYYKKPDVLLSEDNSKPLAIVDGPIQDGSGYVYTVRIQTDNPAVYLNPQYLQPGARFTKGWTSVAQEMNADFGTQQAPNSFKLESQVSTFAQEIKVTDRAKRMEGRLGVDFMVTDPSTGAMSLMGRKFLPFFEARMWNEFYKTMEIQGLLGTKSNAPDLSGYLIKTGPGVRAQVADGWTESYSTPPTITRLKDYLMNILVTRNSEQNRVIQLWTGTVGAMMFHDAISAVASGYLTVDSHFITGIPSKLTSQVPELAYGAQFTRYRSPQGLVIDLMFNPMYDDARLCQRYHPLYPSLPVDSARMTFLDFGMSEGEDNIAMLRVKDSFSHGHTMTLVGPNGMTQGGMMSSVGNSYTVACQGTFGVRVKDVTRTGELIYDFDF